MGDKVNDVEAMEGDRRVVARGAARRSSPRDLAAVAVLVAAAAVGVVAVIGPATSNLRPVLSPARPAGGTSARNAAGDVALEIRDALRRRTGLVAGVPALPVVGPPGAELAAPFVLAPPGTSQAVAGTSLASRALAQQAPSAAPVAPTVAVPVIEPAPGPPGTTTTTAPTAAPDPAAPARPSGEPSAERGSGPSHATSKRRQPPSSGGDAGFSATSSEGDRSGSPKRDDDHRGPGRAERPHGRDEHRSRPPGPSHRTH